MVCHDIPIYPPRFCQSNLVTIYSIHSLIFPAFLYKGTITDKHIAFFLFSYNLPGTNSFPQSLNPTFYGANILWVNNGFLYGSFFPSFCHPFSPACSHRPWHRGISFGTFSYCGFGSSVSSSTACTSGTSTGT